MTKGNPGAIELLQAQAFLAKRFDTDPSTVEFVGEGAWSRCFGFRREARDLVIRFGIYLDDFQKDEIAWDYARSALPIPEVLEIGAAFDGYFAVSRRIRGKPLESLSAADWKSITPAVASALESLRLTDLSSKTGYGGWNSEGDAPFESWADYLLNVGEDSYHKRTHGWRKKLASHPSGEAAFESGYDLLKRIVPQSVPRCLIHGDLINRNVLVQEHSISGILDWGCSAYGDHLYDLAWFEFWSPWHPALNIEYLRVELAQRWQQAGYVPDNLKQRLKACYLHIGLDHLAYNAFTENWAVLAQTAERMQTMVTNSNVGNFS